jgi:hypothetical protein
MTHQEPRNPSADQKHLQTGDQPPLQSRTLSPRSCAIHIEELVLHGIGSRHRDRIGEVVQQELARLLAEQGMPVALAQGGEIVRLAGGSFEVVPGASAEAMGIQVARAVYEGLRR